MNIDNLTILMPVAKCNDFAIIAIKHLLENFDNQIIILYDEKSPQDYIENKQVRYIKNQYGRNFPKILNQLFQANQTDFGFLCNWRQKPKKNNIEFALNKLYEGYGFVDLASPLLNSIYHNNIFSKIGFIDERYVGGHCVDWDIVYTLLYNNIAHYCEDIEKPDYSLASKENPTFTTWVGDCGNQGNYLKFDIKWNVKSGILQRLMKEKNYVDRNYYEFKKYNNEFLTYEKSVINIPWVLEKIQFIDRGKNIL